MTASSTPIRETIGRFKLSVFPKSGEAVIKGQFHTGTYTVDKLPSMIKLLKRFRQNEQYGHFYRDTVKVHERALELLEGGGCA